MSIIFGDEHIASVEKLSPGFANLSSDNAAKRLIELATLGAHAERKPAEKPPKNAGEAAAHYLRKTYTGPGQRGGSNRGASENVGGYSIPG